MAVCNASSDRSYSSFELFLASGNIGDIKIEEEQLGLVDLVVTQVLD